MAVFNEPTKWAQTLGKDADVVTIPDIAGDTDPSIDKIFPAVFSIPLAHGGKAIPRSVLNGLFKLLGDWSFYQQNGGIASYSAIFDYAIGRVVLYNGNLYKCIHTNGASSTVVTPDSNTAYWQRLDNFVRSVNSVNADDNGNVSITSVNHATTADSATNASHATTADSATRLIGYDHNNWIYLGWDGASLTMKVDDVDSTKGEIITHLNIGSQSVNHATTADSATNATNDSSNRNIVNTYALKSNYPDRIKFAYDTTFKGYVNVTVDQTTWGLITNHNISSQSVNHATTADSATNASHATTADSATRLIGYDHNNWIYLGWDGASLTMKVDDVDSTKGEIITHLNIGSQSVNHATTADSATNATNDSSNRNIVNTYALKSNYPDRIKFAYDTTFKGYVNVTVDQTTWGLITNHNISSQSVNHATTADSATNATNATNLGGYPATKYIRSVTGEIKWFAFNTVPDGYIICNGANVSRTTYADLFNAIGTTFGSGDGSTTFALPNLIDKFAQGSTTVGTVKSAGLPNITGVLRALYYNGDTDVGAFRIGNPGNVHWGPISGDYSLQDYSYFFDARFSSSIYGNSTTVQPPALTLLPCIKY